MQLAGRRALVTGASRGIGLALAEGLATAGAQVALVARSEAAIKDLAARLGGVAYPADLTDPDQLHGLIGRIESDGGPIDVLVNNAGVDNTKAFRALGPGELEQLYRLNLIAPAELCRQVVPGMIERGRGHLVNMSSLAAVAPFAGLTPYASSKAGLSQLTAGLRLELKGTPVKTTLVEVGLVPDTDMGATVDDYRPAADSFRRYRRLGLLADVPTAAVVDATIAAIKGGRRHVRLPRRALLFPLLTEAPRRLNELLLTGVGRRG